MTVAIRNKKGSWHGGCKGRKMSGYIGEVKEPSHPFFFYGSRFAKVTIVDISAATINRVCFPVNQKSKSMEEIDEEVHGRLKAG